MSKRKSSSVANLRAEADIKDTDMIDIIDAAAAADAADAPAGASTQGRSKRPRYDYGYSCSGGPFFAKCTESKNAQYQTRQECEKQCLRPGRSLPKDLHTSIASFLSPREFKAMQSTIRRDRLFPLSTAMPRPDVQTMIYQIYELYFDAERLGIYGAPGYPPWYLGRLFGDPLGRVITERKGMDKYDDIIKEIILELINNDIQYKGIQQHLESKDPHAIRNTYRTQLTQLTIQYTPEARNALLLDLGIMPVILEAYATLSAQDKRLYERNLYNQLQRMKTDAEDFMIDSAREKQTASASVDMEDVD